MGPGFREGRTATPARQPFDGTAGAAAGRQIWPIEMRSSFLRPPYTTATMPRETKTAENIEVMMPMQWTTANPRTGPLPNRNSAMPAISVVMFESRIVPHARS